MAKHKRKLDAADKALIERAVAVGGTAYHDGDGDVIALILKNVARLSLADRKRLREMIDESEADLLAHGGRIVRMPNPANLIGQEKYYATKAMTAAQLEDAIKITRWGSAEGRIAKLKRHVELREIAEKLERALPVEVGRLDKNFQAVIPNDPFWVELAHAESLALAYDAAPRVIRDNKRQAAAKRGGKQAGSSAKARAADWHVGCADKAREMLKQGRAPHELAGILAKRLSKTPRQVRTVLQAAGVLQPQKKEVS